MLSWQVLGSSGCTAEPLGRTSRHLASTSWCAGDDAAPKYPSQVPTGAWCSSQQNGEKNVCVSVCACALQHLNNSCLGRFMAGLGLLLWMSSPSQLCYGDSKHQQREKNCWHGKEWYPNSHSLVNMSQNMRHKGCLLQNRLPRFNNEEQGKTDLVSFNKIYFRGGINRIKMKQ